MRSSEIHSLSQTLGFESYNSIALEQRIGEFWCDRRQSPSVRRLRKLWDFALQQRPLCCALTWYKAREIWRSDMWYTQPVLHTVHKLCTNPALTAFEEWWAQAKLRARRRLPWTEARCFIVQSASLSER